MALLPIHQFFSLNGEIKPNKEFIAAENEGGIYEVLRVIHGIPVFLYEHLERFYHSAELAGKNIRFSPEEIRSYLLELIKINKVEMGNVLISCKINLKAFFIPHVYPTPEQYAMGVECGLLHAERLNPNAKVFQTRVRTQANTLIAEQGFYEVLLLDREQKITEGSRSNVFFITASHQVITPKAHQVLLGITRQKTIACAKALNFHVEEADVSLNDLDTFESVFLTGTSPKILPVNQIAEHRFNAKNVMLRKLMLQYEKMIEHYLDLAKNNHPSDQWSKG